MPDDVVTSVFTGPVTQGLRLGAMGWQHVSWQDQFYPNDLPEEWQLAYYNTQFSCVWVPRERWMHAPLVELAQWIEDTQDSFRFVIEARQTDALVESERLGMLTARLGSLCETTSSQLLWFDRETPLPTLASQLRQIDKDNGPIYLLSRDADLAKLEQVRILTNLLGL